MKRMEMNNRKSFLAGIALLSFCALASVGGACACGGQNASAEKHVQDRNLRKKSALSNTFPRVFDFRGENGHMTDMTYGKWSRQLVNTSGFNKKFMGEEVPVNPEARQWAVRYVKENPEKLALLHLNGEARQLCDFPEVRERYFPGHWVYEEGTMLTSDCPAEADVITVSNARPLKKNGYLIRRKTPVSYVPLMAVMVRLDENGNKLWYESEFVEIAGTDVESGTVKIRRGAYGTEPIRFEGGKTYIAPIAGGLWGQHVMFFYNLSSVCPKDRNGKQAKDLYAEEIAGWFSKGGELHGFDGIAFDVNYFDASRRGVDWDVDNDGKADGGWINGHNVWRDGDIDFLSSLREKLGDRCIISADGQHFDNQQIPVLLNGIESEGLVQHNDMWRGFSRAMNTHLYWMDHLYGRPDFRYVVMKLMGKDAHDDPVRLRRFGAAAASCLGASITVPVGEGDHKREDRNFLPDRFAEDGTLGKPVSGLVRLYESVEPSLVLPGKDLRISSGNCISSASDEGLVLSARSGQAYAQGEVPELVFSVEHVALPAGDIVFEVEAQVLENDSEKGAAYQVPALMWMRPSVLPEYDSDKAYDSYFTDLYGLFGTEKKGKMTFYFRRVEAGDNNLEFRVRGASSILVNSIRVISSADVIMRKFENGTVIVNPSLDPVKVNVSDFFRGPAQEVEISGVDAEYL